jgi:tRNA nucleotidyltransferase (CCA-adding enzyme)
MIAPANLEDDPLRLLRAYRQAAQLNFQIEPHTQSTIRNLAPLLTRVAAERVNTELGYLLNNHQGSYWLKIAWEDGLIEPWFPAKITQIEKLFKVDEVDAILARKWAEFGNNSEWRALAKLACLVSQESSLAEAELMKLKYARTEIRSVVTAIKYLPILQNKVDNLNLREQYFLFLEVTIFFPILALLAIASGVELTKLELLLNCYFDPQDQVAHPTALVTGNDLIQALQIKPSPQIGKLLTEIQIARIEGRINSPQEAINFAFSLLK